MTPIELLRLELTKAREEFERLNAVWIHAGYSHDSFKNRCESWGRWNGIAKAIEVLQANGLT